MGSDNAFFFVAAAKITEDAWYGFHIHAEIFCSCHLL